jgi:hypothetical protein
MSKFKSNAPNGSDVESAIRAIQKDAGVQCRVILELEGDHEELQIRVEAYTDYGTRLGVARTSRRYAPGQAPLDGQILAAIFVVYAQASRLAHSDNISHPTIRRK